MTTNVASEDLRCEDESLGQTTQGTRHPFDRHAHLHCRLLDRPYLSPNRPREVYHLLLVGGGWSALVPCPSFDVMASKAPRLNFMQTGLQGR